MSENRRIVHAAGLVSFFTLLSRIAGLLRDAVIGYYFGTGVAADAFFVAFRIPNLLRRFVAEGAMGVALVPVFTDYLTNRSRTAALRAASALATFMAVVLLALTGIGVLFAPLWTALFAPGFADDPGKLALTVTLTRWLFPYIFLVSMVALTSGVLNALRHFAVPAMSPLFLNLAIIAAAVLICPHLEIPVYGLAYGVLAGGLIQVLLQVPPLLRHGMRLAPRWEPGHEAVRRALGLMAPMVFGAAVYQINLMFNTMLASVLPGGSVSYLWYADRVFEFPLGIFAVALGTAALPTFSTQAARQAYADLRHTLGFSIRLTNAIALPSAVGMMALATPIVSVLFQRGAFGPQEVAFTTSALNAFALGLWSVSMLRVVVPAFYALQDARTPVLIAAVAFAINCVCCLLLMGPVAVSGRSGLADAIARAAGAVSLFNFQHMGLALSASISATVNLVLLLFALRRRLGSLGGVELARSFGRNLIAALAMVPVVRLIARMATWTQPGQTLGHALVLTLAVISGVLVFAVVVTVLGGEEVQVAMRLVYGRWSQASSRTRRVE